MDSKPIQKRDCPETHTKVILKKIINTIKKPPRIYPRAIKRYIGPENINQILC